MQYIDEKFKETSPTETVAKIQGILKSIGLDVFEVWNESGIDNCCSLSLCAQNGTPRSNGKGITREFAQASAYGEFIERLQGGLFFYKHQSIGRDQSMDIQTFAPDAKYMTEDGLIENGDWMDPIIDSLNDPAVTRKSIAKQCRIFACADDGKILTLPFYSIFENKHVYLPIAFVDQIYATNGCCVGNTKEEAWVHALSEMMERNASLSMLMSGTSAPKIPDEVLKKFTTVSKIIEDIRANGEFDIDVFDYSIGNGFPVVSTRIINKKNHSYRVNVAADPVFEIALQRTLTELFQGKNIHNFTSRHNGKILSKLSDFPLKSNVTNQLETSSGLYTADFFANELTCSREPTVFADNSKKTNQELLRDTLELYRKLGRPVYVRNFSYLGFPCYRFVVPGFSEAFSVKLGERISEFAIADKAASTLKNIQAADEEALTWLLAHSKMISNIFGRYHSFSRLSGLPISGQADFMLICVCRAYAAYKLNKYDEAMKYCEEYIRAVGPNDETGAYLSCVNRFLELTSMGVDSEKIRLILYKFYEHRHAERLYVNLDKGLSPYEDLLLCCDLVHCNDCKYQSVCSYQTIKEMVGRVGTIYQGFADGQAPSEFCIK